MFGLLSLLLLLLLLTLFQLSIKNIAHIYNKYYYLRPNNKNQTKEINNNCIKQMTNKLAIKAKKLE